MNSLHKALCILSVMKMSSLLFVECARVMVLAATNRPFDLDEAILRRFSQAFEIGKPDRVDRIKILQVILKGETVDNNIDFNHIAGLCEGYSGSDIFEACKKAAFFPVRDYLKDEKNGRKSQVSTLFYCL